MGSSYYSTEGVEAIYEQGRPRLIRFAIKTGLVIQTNVPVTLTRVTILSPFGSETEVPLERRPMLEMLRLQFFTMAFICEAPFVQKYLSLNPQPDDVMLNIFRDSYLL